MGINNRAVIKISADAIRAAHTEIENINWAPEATRKQWPEWMQKQFTSRMERARKVLTDASRYEMTIDKPYCIIGKDKEMIAVKAFNSSAKLTTIYLNKPTEKTCAI